MNTDEALSAFLALGQRTRLDAYRLLVEAGPSGMTVTEIARTLDVNVSTLSRHLAQLERSGLLRNWRDERQILYATDDVGMTSLMAFLTENCCKADPTSCPYAE